jgi:hypothetical protein
MKKVVDTSGYYSTISLYRTTEIAFDALLLNLEKEYYMMLGYKNATSEIFDEYVSNRTNIEIAKKRALKIIWDTISANKNESL